MALKTTVPRSRRAVLAAAAGGFVALIAGAIGRPAPIRATNGDPLLAGGSFAETLTTTVTNTSGGDGFQGRSGGTGAAAGVVGSSTTGAGVIGASISGDNGSTGRQKIGVRGIAIHDGTSIGVSGETLAGVGIFGGSGSSIPSTATPANTGVYGYANQGTSSIGVSGYSPGGTGVAAGSATGTALAVTGKAHFSRSGKGTILSGKSSLTVSVTGTTTSSKVFALLAANTAGRYVQAVVSASGAFTIYLNTTVVANTPVNWFVLD
jgi:hypothetical protein